jgi:hypothetical protein
MKETCSIAMNRMMGGGWGKLKFVAHGIGVEVEVAAQQDLPPMQLLKPRENGRSRVVVLVGAIIDGKVGLGRWEEA